MVRSCQPFPDTYTQVNRTFLPLLKKTRGRIVNTCSISGLAVLPSLAPYAASKHAAIAYSDVLRYALAGWLLII